MSDTTDNLILEHLRNLRNDVASLKKTMKDEFSDVKQRLSTLEISVSSIRRDIGLHDEVDARQQLAIDKINSRLDQIEVRLEISE